MTKPAFILMMIGGSAAGSSAARGAESRSRAYPASNLAAIDGPADAVVMRLLDETSRKIQHLFPAVVNIFKYYP